MFHRWLGDSVRTERSELAACPDASGNTAEMSIPNDKGFICWFEMSLTVQGYYAEPV
jgi:hypothetical protein